MALVRSWFGYVHRRLHWLVLAVIRAGAVVCPPPRPWDRVAARVPTLAFGPGSSRQFTYYLSGESRVRLESIDDIAEWLLQCEYARDTDLFHEPDFWQHPSAFEQLRRGDCEDFALWAWRKLGEIGIEAEFYVGRVRGLDESTGERQHAWVVYRADGREFLFEPAARSRPRMIRDLADARDEYSPHFAVNHRTRTAAFGGYLLDSRDRERRPRPRQRLEPTVLSGGK